VLFRSKTETPAPAGNHDWTAVQETLFLLSIPGMRESILEGLQTSLDDCSETPGW